MTKYLQSTPGDDPLVVESYYAVSPDRMFEAWTVPEIVQAWFGLGTEPLHSAEIDLKPGGGWRFIKTKDSEKAIGFEGEYLEIVVNRKLVYTWRHIVLFGDGRREVTPDSTVEVTFTADGPGTQVYLVHSGIGSEDARKGVGGGWESCFGRLVDVLANS